ncbi:MAG: hypothetical protein ACLPVY_11255 [Acidimicrobiia bacterium]
MLRPHGLFERDKGAPVDVREPLDIDFHDFDDLHILSRLRR